MIITGELEEKNRVESNHQGGTSKPFRTELAERIVIGRPLIGKSSRREERMRKLEKPREGRYRSRSGKKRSPPSEKSAGRRELKKIATAANNCGNRRPERSEKGEQQ